MREVLNPAYASSQVDVSMAVGCIRALAKQPRFLLRDAKQGKRSNQNLAQEGIVPENFLQVGTCGFAAQNCRSVSGRHCKQDD